MALEPITRQEKIIAGKDLEPITRMEMFLKNFGGGASSWNDLKDKPFYAEVATIEHISGVTVTTVQVTDPTLSFAYAELPSFEMVEGNTYSVTFDGERYSNVAAKDNSSIVFGNFGIVNGNDTGEPFFVEYHDGDVTLYTAEAGTHTISVSGTAETVQTIAPKFMPKPNIVYNNNWQASLNSKQIFSELLNGRTVYFCVGASMDGNALYSVSEFAEDFVSFAGVNRYTRVYSVDQFGKVTATTYDLYSLKK